MYRVAILIGLAALLLLPACEQRQEQAKAPQQQPAVATQEPATPPPAAQPAPAPEAARPAETATAPPATGQAPGQEQAVAQQPGQPEQQAGQPGQTREAAEFMGQAPKVEDAPETITLEAKNGNVTLPHRQHAGMMECKSCHGEGKPGPMPDFSKDKAHALCQGCHKDKGAGPTKCPDCHKKQ